jgi:protein-tyrosine phosphatase
VLRAIAAREAPDLELSVDSAGTADYHVGDAPDPRSQAAGAARGYDLSQLRARQVCVADFTRFDLLLAMDADNLAQLQAQAPAAQRDRVKLLLEFAPESGHREVPDPYYGGPAGFELVLDLAEQGARGLVRAIRSGGGRL